MCQRHALIKVLHALFQASDNTRTLFVDLIRPLIKMDHIVLMQKVVACNFPQHIVLWSLDILANRKQIVKTNNFSLTVTSNAGASRHHFWIKRF